MLISCEDSSISIFADSGQELDSFIENALAIADFIDREYNTVILNVRIRGQTWLYIIICRMTPSFPVNRKNASIILYDDIHMGMAINITEELNDHLEAIK